MTSMGNINLSLSLLILSISTSQLVVAEDEADVFNYDAVADSYFWDELYRGGGWTLYCGYQFSHEKKTDTGKAIGIDHIYPTNWMFRHLGCGNRLQCRANNTLYKKMEADLHNLYPVWQAMVTYRYDLHYGIISGEDWRFDDCDFEWKLKVAEPREKARGNIARAMLYMHTRYGVPIENDLMEMFKQWNRKDPPSKQEISRNDRIEKLQGQRNPYIDDPGLAEQIRMVKR